jgi:XTP/dITP diphosphohydrolase
MAPAELVLATANPGKVRELRRLVAEWGPVSVRSLADWSGVELPPEDGATYEENAVLKARAVSQATGLAALADDTGLEVAGLDGGPGVRSARFAPTNEERLEKLLAALRGRPEAARAARFVCVVALAWPDGSVETAAGECRGRIAETPSGDGGFGYDPVFVADDLGVTFAEASAAEKEAVSHRGRAVRALGDRLAEG